MWLFLSADGIQFPNSPAGCFSWLCTLCFSEKKTLLLVWRQVKLDLSIWPRCSMHSKHYPCLQRCFVMRGSYFFHACIHPIRNESQFAQPVPSKYMRINNLYLARPAKNMKYHISTWLINSVAAVMKFFPLTNKLVTPALIPGKPSFYMRKHSV